MKINFKKGAWTTDEITHAYCRRFKETYEFLQNEDSIENAEIPSHSAGGYDYLSLVSREKFTLGTKITARCSFEESAAPLIVIPKALEEDADGHMWYDDYFEAVVWKNGVNVWRLWPKEDGTITWHKRLGMEFPVTPGEIHTLSVEFKENYLVVELDGFRTNLRTEDMFSEFHLGITGCEGPCKFYDMVIEKV